MQVMRYIQSASALIFFIMIHIPLSKISSLFAILTALVPMILDKGNKEMIYKSLHQIVYLDMARGNYDSFPILRKHGS
jgi:hypothetical protein